MLIYFSVSVQLVPQKSQAYLVHNRHSVTRCLMNNWYLLLLSPFYIFVYHTHVLLSDHLFIHKIFLWVGCHALLQGDLPDPGTEPVSPVAPALQADSLPLSHWGSLKELLSVVYWEKDGKTSPDVFLRGFQDDYFYYVCYFFNFLLWKILNIWEVEK